MRVNADNRLPKDVGPNLIFALYAVFRDFARAINELLGWIGSIKQNSQTGNYTLTLDDQGKHIYHPSGAGAGDTFTIPANSSVAFEIGKAVTFINMDSNNLSIAITSDTLYLAGPGTTGTRTLAQYGVATAVKIDSTAWIISGTGLT